MRVFAIVGGGMTGGVAAKTLREEGFDGRVVLITNEPGLPFGRPPLSKEYLRGDKKLPGWMVAPAEWYERNTVEIVRATATRLDTTKHRLELDGADDIEYSKLLIATGGRNRPLDVPGADLEGIFQLRTVADCDAIKQAAHPGARALVVGMGFIGCEVAASLRALRVEVSAVFPGDAPLQSVLGAEMGAVMTAMHQSHGVDLIPGDSVTRIEGDGRAERAVTKSGRKLGCDFAVVAVGIQPSVELLRDTSIEVDNGVLVDPQCRTNVPDVFAAGDVANHLHRSSDASASSTTTTPRSTALPPRARCWAQTPSTTTYTRSGRTSTTRSSSTRATCASGTSSSCAARSKSASSSASTSKPE